MLKKVRDDGIEVKYGWINKWTLAEIDRGKDTITLNIWLAMAELFIHEYLHHIHPRWSEARVAEQTRKKMITLSSKKLKEMSKDLEDLFFTEVQNE